MTVNKDISQTGSTRVWKIEINVGYIVIALAAVYIFHMIFNKRRKSDVMKNQES